MTAPPDFTPFVPVDAPALHTAASGVLDAAQCLGNELHPVTLSAVATLLRTVNCYYSNLIEGHDTHPSAIERAMAEDYDAEPARRNLQIEAQAHIAVQELLEAELDVGSPPNVCDSHILRTIHREFFERLPDDFRTVRSPDGTRAEKITPGEFRAYAVQIGRHVPPAAHEIEGLLATFAHQYDSTRYATPNPPLNTTGIVAAAAAHHRLLWIHPFGDGNGRVTRLMTDAYLRETGAGGYGLWTVSRGLARRSAEYRTRLQDADDPRGSVYEGRGALTFPGLARWCEFFIEVCADQIRFMSGLLDVDTLADRAAEYGTAREQGRIGNDSTRLRRPLNPGRPSVGAPKGTATVLRRLIVEGEVPSRAVARVAGVSPATAYRIIELLRAEGFVEKTGYGAPLRVRFPVHAVPYLFPTLTPPVPSA